MVVAIVTARSGSKGLVGKNMLSIGNKPLIEYTLNAALESVEIDEVILSTDIDEAIAKYSNISTKLKIPYKRPAHLCSDESTHVAVLNDLCQYFENENKNKNVSFIILLQPTSPFRTSDEINEGVRMLKNGFESVLGVCKVMHHPADYLYLNEQQKLTNILPEWKGKRRQEFPEMYFNNGAFYGCSLPYFKKNQRFYDEESGLLLMNENTLIDIDTPFDMKIAKLLINETLH